MRPLNKTYLIENQNRNKQLNFCSECSGYTVEDEGIKVEIQTTEGISQKNTKERVGNEILNCFAYFYK